MSIGTLIIRTLIIRTLVVRALVIRRAPVRILLLLTADKFLSAGTHICFVIDCFIVANDEYCDISRHGDKKSDKGKQHVSASIILLI